MRAHELGCIHGVGHSADVHGCDGCCSIIAKAVEERIIKLLENTQQNSSFMKAMSELQDKTADGSDVVEMWLIVSEYVKHIDDLIALIKGETK